MNITHAQFETLIRRENPEVYTAEQMSSWVECQKEVLLKSDLGELNDIEKAAVDEFNEEFKSFTKVTVITSPSDENLSKGLQYTDFYIRERQVEWKEVDNIIKSVDGGEDTIEKGREGVYTNTSHNRRLGRVGAKFGQHSAQKEEGDSGESKKPESETGKELPWSFKEFENLLWSIEDGDEDHPGKMNQSAEDKFVKKLEKMAGGEWDDYVSTGGGVSTADNFKKELEKKGFKFKEGGSKEGKKVDWEKELVPYKKELVSLVTELDEHYGDEDLDPTDDKKGNEILSRIHKLIKEHKIPESVFESVVKKFPGMDLSY